jgi:hypothetical protein
MGPVNFCGSKDRDFYKKGFIRDSATTLGCALFARNRPSLRNAGNAGKAGTEIQAEDGEKKTG